MLWRIYPKPKNREDLLTLSAHLYEEILEVLIELDSKEGGLPDMEKVLLETVDVVEKSLDISSLLGVLLAPMLALCYRIKTASVN